MENVVELYEQVTQQAYRDGSALDLVVVEGVVPTQHTTYATQTNVQLAHAPRRWRKSWICTLEALAASAPAAPWAAF